ncbi:hypothetical protein [Rathayibacter toxicus]|uniref:hypothetical protein n=1 Tax=Rathayibacter toxicus TaxID=145458 RepID=UPI001C04A139|nr:hypothetical protein [Rathayibacter toxicus]QWL30827.1 hypothetical protein E2R34_08830 [Rathayibacter toxicus]
MSDTTRKIAAGAHNALSVLVVEEAGFPVLWSSGGVPQGVPDGRFAAMVPSVETAALAGVRREDKSFATSHSFAGGTQDLLLVEDVVACLVAASDAKHHPNFVVMAGRESFIENEPVEASVDQIAAFIARYERYITVSAVPTARTAVSAADIGTLSISSVGHATHTTRSTVAAVSNTLQSITSSGTIAPLKEDLAPTAPLFELQRLPQFLAEKNVVAQPRMHALRNLVLLGKFFARARTVRSRLFGDGCRRQGYDNAFLC